MPGVFPVQRLDVASATHRREEYAVLPAAISQAAAQHEVLNFVWA